MKLQATSQLRVGDNVRRKNNLPAPRLSRAAFVPGKQGGIGGSAASLLSLGRDYKIASILPNGGLNLEGFTLTVSARDVEKV